MPLIKDGQVRQDQWRHLDDDEALPKDADAVTVSLARWERNETELHDWNGRLGLRLDSGQLAEQVGDTAQRFDLIMIAFPAFTDGRGFSTARLLRARYGFTGELRATGHVIRDQFFFLQRVGFDTIELADPAPAAQWAEAMTEVSVVYQPSNDRRVTIPRARWQTPAAAE
ncbi:MAG: DUF934 domain-containing protein [Marinovum algicola]|uniref:DUF934 domain-containing protein n=1 Tax=Marinovum algicola TaxID=42444 RepID=UPI0032F01E29